MKKAAKIINLFMPCIVAVICALVAVPILKGVYGYDSIASIVIATAFGVGWIAGSLVEYLTMRAAGGPGYKEWK